MLPIRVQQVIKSLLSAGVAALIATTATITTLTATSSTLTNATSTTLVATYATGTNMSIGSLTSNLTPPSGNTITLGTAALSFSGVFASGTSDLKTLLWTNTTGTNIFATNGTSTNFGFTDARGTNILTTNVTGTNFLSSATTTIQSASVTSFQMNSNSATTTLYAGNRFCLVGKDTGGTVRYIYIDDTGTIATSTSACN